MDGDLLVLIVKSSVVVIVELLIILVVVGGRGGLSVLGFGSSCLVEPVLVSVVLLVVEVLVHHYLFY